jgi:SAM-dependent methyltransferase
MRQLTDDWQERYLNGDVPWEDPTPWPGLEGVFTRFVTKGLRVLDVGCGLGINTTHLAELGYEVIGIDVSEFAIARARERGRPSGCQFRVLDFMADAFTGVDAVFDRGCFHSFSDAAGRRSFANRAFAVLEADGLWINVSGSAENGESPEEIQEMKLPRLSVHEIADAVEPFFQFVEVQRAPFGTSAGRTDFDAFVSVLRRRRVHMNAG